MSLVLNWIAAKQDQLLGKPLDSEKDEAIIELLDLILDNPESAFKTILQIIEQQPSDSLLACLGAGPIESLLTKHPEYLGKLIASVNDTNALKQCLLRVDYDDEDGLDVNLLENFLKS